MHGKLAITIDELVQRHHAEVYRYAYRLCGSVADAEDLSQQVFLTAHQKLHQLREVEKARAWLFTILRNCYWRMLEQRRMIPSVDADWAQAELADPRSEGPWSFGEAELWIDQERLQQALDALPVQFRIVVMMFYFEELSYREIAAALDMPEGTVMSRLSRAKARLKNLLQPRSGALDAKQR